MTPREYAKANRHIGEAWEDGKTIEFKRPEAEHWRYWDLKTRPCFDATNWQWRIKPEPPQPKFRPFTHTEIPVGAVLRYKNNQQSVRFVIISSQEHGMFGYNTHCSYNELLGGCEYKWPHEDDTKWRPCGVEVKE